MVIPQVVKIHSERGHGDDCWKVLSGDSNHHNLQNLRTQEKLAIYKAHTYVDMDCARVKSVLRAELIAKANQIGRKR